MAVLVPGAELGRCRIEETIGRGGMGVVYRAHQLDLGRDVAVKVISPERVEDPAARRRFLREVRAAASVEHPNVLPVHGAGEEDGHAYVVMRYVAGDDLRSLVRLEGPLAPARAAEIVQRLGDALDAIHRAGYVHRDVKPANVLLDERGQVYLSDFGIAKHLLGETTQTEPERWVGTLDFAAPEQIRGEPVDARTDVYALGCVLFFMLTGRVPFERDSDEAKLWAHLSDPPPAAADLRPGLAPAFDIVLRRALAKEPGDRQPTAGQLGREAVAAVTDDAPTITSPRRRRPRRRPALAAAAAGLLAVLALVVAWVVPGGGREPATPTPSPTATPVPAQAPRLAASVTGTVRDVGLRPRDVAVAGGDVWVISHARERIARIDAETLERVRPEPRIAGRGAWSIAGDGDAVWVAVPRLGQVLRIDDSARVTQRIATPLTPVAVAVDRSGLWITGRAERDELDPANPDYVYRYDRAGKLLRSIAVPLEVAAIAPTPTGVWIAVNLQAKVLRYDARDDRPARSVRITAAAAELAFGGRSLWGSIQSIDAVVQVPPGRPSVSTAAARNPSELAVAGGRVFVASNTEHTVAVIDARTGRPAGEPLAVGLNPFAVAAGAGHVWVTGQGDNTVTRIDY